MRALLALFLLTGCASKYPPMHHPLISYDEAEIFGRQDCREMTADEDNIGSQRTCIARDGGRRRI